MSERIDFDAINKAAAEAEHHRNSFGPGTREEHEALKSIHEDPKMQQALIEKAKRCKQLESQAKDIRNQLGPGTGAEASLRNQIKALDDSEE